MSAFRLIAFLIVVQSIACGCCTHRDLTKSPEIRADGTLGQHFRTTEQLDLVKDTHARVLFLAKRDYPTNSNDKKVGVVDAGTELGVNQVVRVTELVAVLVVLPEYWSWNCTLAKIEDGPYAGKEVAVVGEGLLFKKDPATNGSTMLVRE